MSQGLGSAGFALGGLALGALIGGGIGFAAHMIMEDPVEKIATEPLIIKQELTEDEIMAFCKEEVDDERNKLFDAQDEVEDLAAQLKAKEAELAELKTKTEVDETKRAAATKRWTEMEKEIEDLKTALVQAETERDEALVELKETVWKLEVQIKETETQRQRAEHYRDESHQNLWTSFRAEAKVEICEKGTKRRHDKCQETIEAALASFKDQFMECVDSYQSTPLLMQAEKDATLPSYAQWLDQDKENRDTKKGWYIQFCDPTLPESEDI